MLFTSIPLVVFSGLLANSVSAFYSGWNLPSTNPDGSCKRSADWAADFAAITTTFRQQFAAGTPAVKVFTSLCDTAVNIRQPAIDFGVKILATTWASEDVFGAEKAALNSVVARHGCDWLAAICVGSEDIYRKDATPQRIAEQIYDVRGMVRQYGGSCSTVPVTHADTVTEWANPSNAVVVDASDVILSNAFAYWAGVPVSQVQDNIRGAILATQRAARGKQVWIGETGWPTGGDNFKSSVPSVANLREAWRMTKCPQNNGPLYGLNHFWFSTFDEPRRAPGVEQHFGVATADRKLKISLSCP